MVSALVLIFLFANINHQRCCTTSTKLLSTTLVFLKSLKRLNRKNRGFELLWLQFCRVKLGVSLQAENMKLDSTKFFE